MSSGTDITLSTAAAAVTGGWKRLQETCWRNGGAYRSGWGGTGGRGELQPPPSAGGLLFGCAQRPPGPHFWATVPRRFQEFATERCGGQRATMPGRAGHGAAACGCMLPLTAPRQALTAGPSRPRTGGGRRWESGRGGHRKATRTKSRTPTCCQTAALVWSCFPGTVPAATPPV